MNSVPRKAEELVLNASAGHTWNSQDASGTMLKFGKEKGNLEAWSKRVNFMSEIFARPVLRNNHLRKPHDKQIVPAKQRGNWRDKYQSSKPKIKLRFTLLWMRQRHRKSYVWYVIDSGALRRSRNTTSDWPRPGQCTQTSEDKFLCMISICS